MNLQKNKKFLKLLLQIVGWVIFFLYILPDNSIRQKESLYFICDALLLMGYFYLNLYILIPRLLLNKKIIAYIGVSLLFFSFFSFALPSLMHNYFGPPVRPPNMPFPQGSFGVNSSQESSLMYEIISRLRMYNMRLHNPTFHFLLIFIISTVIKILTQLYSEQQQSLELEKSRVQAELSFLKSQIHPHFLFNCLNNIYFMTLSKDDKTPKTVLSLSNFLRFVITESDSSFISMTKEISMLDEYLDLQGLRTTEKFELQYIKEGDFSTHSIMPLTFIPFVENAFKYGISTHINCFIHIKIIMDNGTLTFLCNNSITPNVKDSFRSSGVGLENIKKRLELAYPNHYSLKISEENSAFHVKLKIDIV